MKEFEIKTERYHYRIDSAEGKYRIIADPINKGSVSATFYCPKDWAPTRVMQFIESFEETI